MRASHLFAIVSLVAAPMSCSLITSYAGLGSGGAGGDATTTTSGSGSNGGGGQAGHGGATSHAGGSGGATTSSGGGGGGRPCEPGGTYCGGNGVHGDPKTLYKCEQDGKLVVDEVCTRKCVIAPPTPNPQEDLCSCKAGGSYCGGDDVIGDSDSLYQCTGGVDGTLIMVCKNGCVVVPGDDDKCAAD